MVTVSSWILEKFRCGSHAPNDKGRIEEEITRDDTPSPIASSANIDPVVYVDKEGFEWAINDGPPERPPSIPASCLFIPFEVRPVRGYLTNQVLTNSEIPDIRSPERYSGPCLSIHTEQLFRRLRSRSQDVSDSTGAHVRSRSGKRLIRQDLRKDSAVDRSKPENRRDFARPRAATNLDLRTYLDLRARMAACRR
jgi:hypothetical protein